MDKNETLKTKNVVLTIAIGDLYSEVSEVTHPTIKRYADKIGADFVVWRDQGNHMSPHFRKLDIVSLFKEYDRVLYVDTDIIIREDAPNIFDIVPYNEMGMFDEGRFIPERGPNMLKYLTSFGVDPKKWDRKYYNTGVMVFSKVHHLLFMKPPEEFDNFYEQTHINMMICILGGKVHDLSYKFNRMYVMDEKTGETRLDSYFLHYAGFNAAMPKDNFLGMIKQDIELWEKAKEVGYKFPRNIVINVEGGMGDQICAEPVIRRIRDHVYKDGNIVVMTDFPDVFTHIKLPVYKKNEKDTPTFPNFFKINTMNSPEHKSWEHMSHALCHGVDFAALQCLRGTLAAKDKTIQLEYSFHDIAVVSEACGANLEDLVLLHPGRGWDSKTFPADVWESWLDALIADGKRVAVIGKHISKEQGIVEIPNLDKKNCYNFINKFNFKQTLALIAHAKVLISNDSAPVHMAGAFDNWIGLIATCKHPELILPYRNGSVWYKARALEKKKMYEEFNNQPSQVDGATIDFIPTGDIRPYLPTSEEVVKFVNSCF